jgi:hypothetical protein
MAVGIPARVLSGNSVEWTDVLAVEARREGNDLDGRLFLVVATLKDVAGNSATASASIVVPHDQGKR